MTTADLNVQGLYARVGGWLYLATIDDFIQVETEVPSVTIPNGPWFPSARETSCLLLTLNKLCALLA